MDAQTANTIGGLCQLVGVALVIIEVVAIYRYRGDPDALRSAALRRLRRVVSRRDRTVAPPAASPSPSAGAVRLGSPPARTATIEERLAALERRGDERPPEAKPGRTRLGWFGVVLLLVGIVFTTWPSGIAGWPGWLPGCIVGLLALALEYRLIYRPQAR